MRMSQREGFLPVATGDEAAATHFFKKHQPKGAVSLRRFVSEKKRIPTALKKPSGAQRG